MRRGERQAVPVTFSGDNKVIGVYAELSRTIQRFDYVDWFSLRPGITLGELKGLTRDQVIALEAGKGE